MKPTAGPDADLSPALGVIDARGQLVASNHAYRRWLERAEAAPLIADGLRQFLAGATSVEAPTPPNESMRFDRLDGTAGPLVLVTIKRSESAPTVALDALTQLPDRRAVADRADAWRRAAAPSVPRFAVLFLDLDDFKLINDRHGHAVGDAVLQSLAARWVNCIRDGDLVARYGGDEFVVLVQGAATPEEVESVMRRLEDAAQQPVAVGELSLQVAGTVGWATPANAHWTIDDLVAAADRDMYARKGRVIR